MSEEPFSEPDTEREPDALLEGLKNDDLATDTVVDLIQHADHIHDAHGSQEDEEEIVTTNHPNFQSQEIETIAVREPLYSQANEAESHKTFTHYILTDNRLHSTSSLMDDGPVAQAVSMENVEDRTQFFDLSEDENDREETGIKACNFGQEPTSPTLKNMTITHQDKQSINKSLHISAKPLHYNSIHTSVITQEILNSDGSQQEIPGQMHTHIPVSIEVDGTYTVHLQTCHDGNSGSDRDLTGKNGNEDQNIHTNTHVFAPTLITLGPPPSDKIDDNQDIGTSKEVVNQQWLTTKDDKKFLQCQGMIWRQGMWSREEEALLKANIEDFCKASGISDPTAVIFETPKDERKDFYRSVAKGIQRPLFAIYRKVLRMYDNKNYVGKYTSDEVDRLQELRRKYGNDWAAIGGALGRSASSVKDRCRLFRANKRTGKWTVDEERTLSEAVRQQTNTTHGESVTTGIVWSTVAEKVGTRTEKQCRAKWLNYLNWKEAGGADWSRTDESELISRVASIDTDDENDIDWVKLADRWPSVRSPQWLRGKWWTLKKKVPNSLFIGFRDIIKYLQTTYMDSLKVKIDRQGMASVQAKSPASYRSNALSSLSSQFHQNSSKILQRPPSERLASPPASINEAEPQVSARNIVITDGFTGSNAFDTNPQNFVQFQLTAISPQPFLLHTVQSGAFPTSLGEQFVLHPISMANALGHTSSDDLESQGGFIVHNVPNQVSEEQDDRRAVEFSQAMVQTDLSIPIPTGSISHEDLERANLEAIDDEISRNIEPLEDSTDNVSENQLEVQFGLEEPTVVEIQPDEIIEQSRDGKDTVETETPGIVTITMETVRNVSINVEHTMSLDSDISDLKDI